MNKKLLNSIALTLTLAKQGNKKESASVERFTNSVETYNVLDENVTSSTDAEKIRPITMGLNVIGSSEGAEVTDSEKNLTLHWDDVWDEIVNISSDSPDIVAEFDNLSIILKQIDQLVSVSNFEEAGSKTTQFLTYIKTLPGKYGSAVKYSQLEETIAQGIGKLFYDASKKKILVDLNDDYLSFLLKGFEKVKEFTAPKVGTHHKVDHQHFNANTYEFTYYSGKLGSQDKKGTFLVVKNEEPIGTYRGTFEGCSRIINHLMFQPHMLGYKKDALQGWIKNAGEVAIQNVFFDSVEDAQEWQKTQEDKAKEYNENQSEGIPNATGPDGKATPPIPGSNDPNKNKDNLKEDLMNSPGSNAPVDSLRESVPDMQKDRMDFEHRQTKPLANKNKYKNQLESSTEEIIVRDVGAEVKRLKPFSNSEYVKGKVTDIVSKDFAKVKWDDGSISISRIDSMIWSTKTKLNHRIAVSTQEGTAWVRRILEPMDYEDDEQVKAILNSSSSVDERVDKVVDRIKEISVASSDEDAIIQSVDWDTINVSMSDIISMIEDHDDDRVIEKEYQDKHESSKYGSLLKKSFNINTKHATILRKAYSGDAEVDKSFETPEYTVPANSLDFQAGLKLVTRNYPGLLTPMAMYIMKKCVDENKPILLTGANYDTEVGYNDISVDVGTTGLGIAVATAFYKDKIITCHLDNWDGLFVRCYAKTRDKAKEWMSEFENKLITENQYRGKCLYATDNALAFQDIPKVAWDDVILDEKVKKDIRLNTVSFLGDIKLAKAGVSKRGLILYGPPGTGKTSVVKAVFSELGNNNVSRVYVTAESFYKMKASGLFDILSYLGPTVLAFEDIDMVGTSRDLMIGGGNLLGDLLTNLDGMRNNIDPLVVMASTNKIEMMDEALSNRPCRFDRKIELNLPSAANLVRIYNKLMGGVLTEDGEVIKLSKNFTGSHVVETVNTAKILAAHEDKELADCLVEAVNIIRDNFFAGQSIVELQAKVKHTLVKQGASKKADDELLKEFPLSPKKVDEFSKGDKVQTSKGEGTIGGIVRRDFYNYAVVLYEINYPDGSRELLRPSKVKKGSIFLISEERDNINAELPPVATSLVSFPHPSSFWSSRMIRSTRPRVPQKTPDRIAATVS